MKPAAPTAVVVRLAAGASFWRLFSIVVAGLVSGLCRAADFSGASATFTSNDPVVMPDATADEVAAWAAEARLASRVIDGRRRLHRRAAENLFLFSPQARGRRASVAPPPPARWSLVDHTEAVVAEATRTGSVRVLPMRFRVTHTVTVPTDQAAIRPGSRVQAWLPFPQETDLQRDVRIVEASPGSPRVAAAGRLKPRAEGCLQRSVFLESVVSGPPHIVFTPEICREVAEICGTATSPLARARRIFRWVSRSIPWQAEDDYSTIPSVAVRGFTVRRGDCGVQNTLFITMCRIAGIPVRWQSGFEMRPATGIGMHDWAEIYVDPWGWLPADASYGVQASDDPRMANFFCGCRDSQRSECRCSRKAPRRHGGGRSRGFSGVWHLRRSRRNTEGLARPPRTPS